MATTTARVVSTLVVSNGVERIKNISCPDGKRRSMLVQGVAENGYRRGYVQVGGCTVAGYAKPTGRGGLGWRFHPLINGKNSHLLRPTPIAMGAAVTIRDRKIQGNIVAIGWNHLTPTYSIKPLDRRYKNAIVEIGADNLTVH